MIIDRYNDTDLAICRRAELDVLEKRGVLYLAGDPPIEFKLVTKEDESTRCCVGSLDETTGILLSVCNNHDAVSRCINITPIDKESNDGYIDLRELKKAIKHLRATFNKLL